MTNGETKKSGTEGAAGPGAEAGTEGAAAPEAAQPRTPSRRALLGWGGAGLALGAVAAGGTAEIGRAHV